MSQVAPHAIDARLLGRVDYAACNQAMQDFTAHRDEHTADALWLCEHAPTFTQGLAGKAEHVLVPGGRLHQAQGQVAERQAEEDQQQRPAGKSQARAPAGRRARHHPGPAGAGVRPQLTMADMGHGDMGGDMAGMDHGSMSDMKGMDHGTMGGMAGWTTARWRLPPRIPSTLRAAA